MILDFGEPWNNGTEYGTMLFGSGGGFASLSESEDAVLSFIDGYVSNCGATGHLNGHLTIGVGTNNEGPYTNFADGQAWGQSAR